jgi:hypothetical protein
MRTGRTGPTAPSSRHRSVAQSSTAPVVQHSALSALRARPADTDLLRFVASGAPDANGCYAATRPHSWFSPPLPPGNLPAVRPRAWAIAGPRLARWSRMWVAGAPCMPATPGLCPPHAGPPQALFTTTFTAGSPPAPLQDVSVSHSPRGSTPQAPLAACRRPSAAPPRTSPLRVPLARTVRASPPQGAGTTLVRDSDKTQALLCGSRANTGLALTALEVDLLVSDHASLQSGARGLNRWPAQLKPALASWKCSRPAPVAVV